MHFILFVSVCNVRMPVCMCYSCMLYINLILMYALSAPYRDLLFEPPIEQIHRDLFECERAAYVFSCTVFLHVTGHISSRFFLHTFEKTKTSNAFIDSIWLQTISVYDIMFAHPWFTIYHPIRLHAAGNLYVADFSDPFSSRG